MPIFPELAPPFHQIPLPALAAPPRKLHTVRFSILTSFASQTRMPLRPSALPLVPTGPKFCAAGSELHAVEDVALVPSTITLVRLIPRRWTFDLVIRTPPKSPYDA